MRHCRADKPYFRFPFRSRFRIRIRIRFRFRFPLEQLSIDSLIDEAVRFNLCLAVSYFVKSCFDVARFAFLAH